jgi:pentose-5-phosphate-3-epimerase
MTEEKRLAANRLSAEIKRLSDHLRFIKNKTASQIHIDDCDFHTVVNALEERRTKAKEEFDNL